MLYFFYGSNTEKSGSEARKLVSALRLKKPNAVCVVFDRDTFEAVRFEELIASRGLFEAASIIFCIGVCEDAGVKSFITERIPSLASSRNIFLFREGVADKELRLSMEEHASKMQEYTALKTGTKKYQDEFNIFSLADALGRRDRKSLWVLYRRALSEHLAPEEIHGTLFRQVKNMLLARGAESASEAALKPFIFAKAKKFSGNYTVLDLKNFSSRLTALYHNARMSGPELEISLERFILDI